MFIFSFIYVAHLMPDFGVAEGYMAHRIEARSSAQPYEVKYVNTFARCTSWGADQLQDRPPLCSVEPHSLKHKRVVVVHVRNSDKPVTIPLKDCMRDPKVDELLQPTLFLSEYTYPKKCQYYEEYPPTSPIIKEFFGLLSQHKLVLRMDSLGHTVTTGYAEVYAPPSDFEPSLAPLMRVPILPGWDAGAHC